MADRGVTEKECILKTDHVNLMFKKCEEHVSIVFENFEDRITKVETTTAEIHSLALAVRDLAGSITNMVKDQNEQKEDIEVLTNRLVTIESRDGEKWRETVKYVFFAILGAVVSLALQQIGLK